MAKAHSSLDMLSWGRLVSQIDFLQTIQINSPARPQYFLARWL